jgi:AdoMet-dependent rRNA methyltransferase SPB1
LPEWFVDDEAKHYRPQLPVPKALMDSIKQRFTDLTAKPIKKVAEARARKRKRAGDKLKAAKKKAEAVSQAPDLSEKEKLRAIGKALNSAKGENGTKKDGNGKPVFQHTKKLVVARKAMGGKLPKGQGKAKMVDKRQKHDTRIEKRADKRKKNAGKKKAKRHSGGAHKG